MINFEKYTEVGFYSINFLSIRFRVPTFTEPIAAQCICLIRNTK